mmetsp:Transcript_20172/g.55906  ORF Transcript_20172/g.55906 Transcript_20172/m.55906 type:complete len:96 (-) Transcript_20172:155-442(-)
MQTSQDTTFAYEGDKILLAEGSAVPCLHGRAYTLWPKEAWLLMSQSSLLDWKDVAMKSTSLSARQKDKIPIRESTECTFTVFRTVSLETSSRIAS